MRHRQDVRWSPPLLFQAARWLQAHRVRGSHRFAQYARTRGWFDVTVRYRLGARAAVDVPLTQRPYALRDLWAYERSSIEFVAAELDRFARGVALVDCGADIGLVSARLVAACPGIRRVVAFEPNRAMYGTLAANMALLAPAARAECAAVADFIGRGTLAHPPHSAHDHAAYLVRREGGEVAVTTIDALGVPEDLAVALKVDVEGGEAAVLRGARQTLERAPDFLVVFEAHPAQVRRSGVEPIEIVENLQRMRSCAAYAVRACPAEVVEAPREVRLDRPFFSQFPGNVYNVVAISRRAA